MDAEIVKEISEVAKDFVFWTALATAGIYLIKKYADDCAINTKTQYERRKTELEIRQQAYQTCIIARQGLTDKLLQQQKNPEEIQNLLDRTIPIPASSDEKKPDTFERAYATIAQKRLELTRIWVGEGRTSGEIDELLENAAPMPTLDEFK